MSGRAPAAPDRAVADAAADRIVDGFADYNARFADITRRARRHFERRDWVAARRDAVERIQLYDVLANETMARLESTLADRLRSRPLWTAIRDACAARIAGIPDAALHATFFNSITRRFFRTRGVDPALEFTAPPADAASATAAELPLHVETIAGAGDATAACGRLLAATGFGVPFADRARCAAAVARALARHLEAAAAGPLQRVELLPAVFYRERRAYRVGRAIGAAAALPLVLALVSEPRGLRVDAVLAGADAVGPLFGYTRSYFHADLDVVAPVVAWLRALLPNKPAGELYTVLGRAKQGKTERYRHFVAHLAARPDECFVHAEGERGMVMLVFTLPSYPLVVKVIRDAFAWPKDIAREQVVARYRLVFHHDRVGRLVDAQEFRHLRLPADRFEPALREELLEACRLDVARDGDDLVFAHCYLERRLRPLDRYLREAGGDAARAALRDYGQAIKDLARSGIFPGDLLPKNFGVARSGQVVFYDYDELGLIADCRFRTLPPARHDDEETHAGPWYYVGPDDVFPEEFPRFLGVSPELRADLVATHGEIFDPAWWRAVQAAVARGETADVAPYPQAARLPIP